ncbi:MAG: hypothetical protein ABJP66_15895 [Hyphomicrobiales bacterium]
MSNRHHHVNYSDFELDVDVDFDSDVTVNKNWTYTAADEDVVDIDLQDHVKVDEMLVSVHGDIDYNPGDDISVEDILNDSLNGAGNDTGIVMNNSNQVSDSDWASGTSAANNHKFEQTAKADGGVASSDDGISSGGISGSAGIEIGGSIDWWGAEAGLSAGLEIDDLGESSFKVHAGDDALVEGISSAEASAVNDTAAFTNTLIQGQNILNNSLDVTVVGGNMNSFNAGDDALDVGA